MALIKCPECGREISDRAPSCPGCGIEKADIQAILKEMSEQSEPTKDADVQSTPKNNNLLVCDSCEISYDKEMYSACPLCDCNQQLEDLTKIQNIVEMLVDMDDLKKEMDEKRQSCKSIKELDAIDNKIKELQNRFKKISV